jgi:hypothetical protein
VGVGASALEWLSVNGSLCEDAVMPCTAIEFHRPYLTMGMITCVMFCAVAVEWVTACGGGVSHDAAPTGHAVATVAPSVTASGCSSATADVLRSAARRDYGDVDEVLCSGDWAKVLIDTSAVTDANPPSMMLFHRDGNGWRIVTYGSGFDCTNEGVPASIAAELEC